MVSQSVPPTYLAPEDATSDAVPEPKQHKANAADSTPNGFVFFIALFFPPVAVWIRTGCCSGVGCINLLLCMLGWIPGIVHAWWVIYRMPQQPRDVPDEEKGTRNVVVNDPSSELQHPQPIVYQPTELHNLSRQPPPQLHTDIERTSSERAVSPVSPHVEELPDYHEAMNRKD